MGWHPSTPTQTISMFFLYIYLYLFVIRMREPISMWHAHTSTKNHRVIKFSPPRTEHLKIHPIQSIPFSLSLSLSLDLLSQLQIYRKRATTSTPISHINPSTKRTENQSKKRQLISSCGRQLLGWVLPIYNNCHPSNCPSAHCMLVIKNRHHIKSKRPGYPT